MTENRTKNQVVFSLIFHMIGLLTGITGIVIHMLVNSVLDSGFMVKHNLAYFTLQTNIFTCIIFAVLIGKTLLHRKKAREWKLARIHPSLHLACTLYITITMLGYWGILAPLTGIPKNAFLFCDTLFLHTLTPLFGILDWLLFMEHGAVRKAEVFKWMLYPVLYLISVAVIAQFITEPYYTFAMGEKTVELMYPYPFFDPQVVGFGGLAGIIAVMSVVFLLLGSLYIFLDSRLARRKSR